MDKQKLMADSTTNLKNTQASVRCLAWRKYRSYVRGYDLIVAGFVALGAIY
jgi:hypothetical protein